jgi:hypothetical protein
MRIRRTDTERTAVLRYYRFFFGRMYWKITLRDYFNRSGGNESQITNYIYFIPGMK